MRRGIAILVLAPCLLGLRDCGERIFQEDLSQDPAFGPGHSGESCLHCHFRPLVDGEVTPGGFGTRYRSPVLVRVGEGPLTVHYRFDDPRPIPAEARVATRKPPSLGGLGEVDAIPDRELWSREDPLDRDGDGISGRIGGVGEGGRVLRFGRQAHVGTLREFIERALADEHGFDATEQADSPYVAAALEAFVRSIPHQAPPEHLATEAALLHVGAAVFRGIGCSDCHVREVGGVRLYSDLLLHDLGPSLDDGISLNPGCQAEVPPDRHHTLECSTREFRTPSLRGAGHRLRSELMHDGRAKDLEMAVRLHGGEAARSRDAWLALPSREQRALMLFVQSL